MAQNKQVNAVISAITPTLTDVFTKALTALSDSVNQHIADVEHQNEQLSARCKELTADIEKKSAEFDKLNATATEVARRCAELEQRLAQTPQTTKPLTTKPTKPIKGIRHIMFDKIRKCVEYNKPIYLCGPAGTGKTQLCKEVADDLGLDFYMTAKVDDKFGIEGYMDGHGNYNDTPFYKAMKNGGLFMFDELDASDSNAIVAVNTAIANRYFTFPNGEMVQAHENFRVVACGNTFGTGADEQYTGRQPLDASTIDRFGYIFVDYDERVELACAKGNKDIVAFVHDLRKAIKKARITTFTISYRAIINLVDYEQMFGLADAMQMAITKGLDNDNVQNISRNLTITNKYASAFSKSATAYATAA